MPKPFYGEAAQLIEAGEYQAVITHVINLGHHTFKEKKMTKFWVEFWIPNLNTSKPLSNFGISTWLSPSHPPFVGFYELIIACEKKGKMAQDELKEYDLYSIAGKTVTVVFEQNEKGYMNISSVKSSDEELKSPEEIVVIGTDDYDDTDLLDKAPEKARALIWQSDEFVENNFGVENTVEEVKDALSKNNALDEEPTLRIEDVPF